MGFDLAIDIVDYMGIAFDGVTTMGFWHPPIVPTYREWYYKPMEEWLQNLTLDIRNWWRTFQTLWPWGAAPSDLFEYAKSRDYDGTEDPEEI